MGLLDGLGRIFDAMSENTKKSRDEHILKEAILDRLSVTEIRLMFRLYGVPEPSGEQYDTRTGKSKKLRLTKRDYVAYAARTMGLGIVKEFAARHAKIHDLIIEERHMEAERTRWRGAGKTSDARTGDRHFDDVLHAISRFHPARTYREEQFYQVELAGFLKHQFPGTTIEVQDRRARPDIIIGNVAVEIKGPTTYRDLANVFDKCVRYTARWGHLIVVLFAVEIDGSRYAEWERSLKKHFPDVVVIRK